MADTKNGAVFSKDVMMDQLGQIDLLMAMYAPDEAIVMETVYADLVESLRAWCESDNEEPPQLADSSINMQLSLDLSEGNDDQSHAKSLQLSLSFPLVNQTEVLVTDQPPVKARIQQPAWMNKNQVSRMTEDMPDADVLTIIEHVKEAALQYLSDAQNAKVSADSLEGTGSFVRVWFYFPSISTRAKRDDLVNHAPTYGLTGFLLAGKPGILCLEGDSAAIDQFMKFIKTESWGDIPPQHKKVSERFREEAPELKRAFGDMREITDGLGERRGERANRNDMRALEGWLRERGLDEAFGRVLI